MTRGARRFRFVRYGSLSLGRAPRYRVKGLLPIAGLCVVWGPPKCGKSFLAFDMLMHVALGWDYRGRRVRRGLVVYAALEGQQGFEARAEAFRQARLGEVDGHGDIPFLMMPTPLVLVRDVRGLVEAIRAEAGEEGPPAVVCLDTLNRSFLGSESDDEAMTAYVRAAGDIADAFGCLVVIVHHCGVEGNRPRGHSALTGAVDAQLAVKKTTEGVISLTVDEMKDGATGDVLTSRLRVIEVGEDEDGDAITSCVIEPADDAEPGEAAAHKAGGRRLPDRYRLALKALAEAVLAAGAPAPPSFDLPGAVTAVPVERWREEMHRRGVITKDDSNPRASFKRLKMALAARSLIGERDGLVWSAERP